MAPFVAGAIGEIVSLLDAVCRTDLAVDDPTRAGLVREWPLQDDPEDYRISILIAENDPTDDNWGHEADYSRIEIGGSLPWIRRFSVHLLCYFTRTAEDYDTASGYARQIMGRIEQALATFHPSSVGDNGESALYHPGLKSSSLMHDGGRDSENVFKGKIQVEFMTE